MIIAVFDTHRFDREALEKENADGQHRFHFYEARLEQRNRPAGLGLRRRLRLRE